MALDPSLFVVFTCAQSVDSFIHSFMNSVILQLTTGNDRSTYLVVPAECADSRAAELDNKLQRGRPEQFAVKQTQDEGSRLP